MKKAFEEVMEEEETFFVSDDIVETADLPSLLEGTAHNSPSMSHGHQKPSLIGYPPLNDIHHQSPYFTGQVDLEISLSEGNGEDNGEEDEETFMSLIGTVTEVEHMDDRNVHLYMDIGNEDYFRLLRTGLKNLRTLDVKLIDPLGNQAVIAKEPELVCLRAKMNDPQRVIAYFLFQVVKPGKED